MYKLIPPAIVVLAITGIAALAASPTAGASPSSPTHSSPRLPAAFCPTPDRALGKNAGESYRSRKAGSYALSKPRPKACIDRNAVHIGGTSTATGGGAVSPPLRTAIARTLGGGYSQQAELTASDPSGEGKFGVSVALSADGDEALVGATDHANYSHYGAAYIFTKSGTTWTQAAEFAPTNEQAFNSFGDAVALSADGKMAVVGDPVYRVDGQFGAGAVYFFTENDGAWTQTAMFADPTNCYGCDPAHDHFGGHVALSADGSTAIVGADYGDGDYGAVVIYKNNGGTWTQQAVIDGQVSAAQFGWALALSADGTEVLVAPNLRDPQTVFVYDENGGVWTQTAELHPTNMYTFQDFGFSVALSAYGTTAVVGATAWPNPSVARGRAFVFTKSDGSWSRVAHLDASDNVVGDGFGKAVALSSGGTTALVSTGLHPWPSDIGAAYVFTDSGGIWAQTAEFTASDAAEGNVFGHAVALSSGGTTALIGAPGDSNVQSYAGKAYVFFRPTGNLSLAMSAPATVGQAESYISQTIATNESSAAVPAVSATITVPAATSFVSATATQGSCSEASGVVTCDFGQISANAGTATANVTLKATGSPGTTIENTASIVGAIPPLTASAPTEITSPVSCPAGYTGFSGHLDAGGIFTSSPITVAESSQKYVDLTSPASFAFFATITSRYGTHTYEYQHARHGHRWGPAGTYQVGVQAGPDAGGDYTLCVNLNPMQ